MSYQGDPTSGNGYWPGHDPPNTYGMHDAHSHFPANGGFPYQRQTNDAQLGQFWDQNGQIQYGTSTGYQTSGFYPSAPPQVQPQAQFQPPQYLNPADLQQYPPPQPYPPPQQQHIRQTTQTRKLPTPTSKSSARMAPAQTGESEIDRPMLLISLAEEYFDAAHELAPSVSMSMKETNVEAYEQLIATGLGCLDTALKKVRLSPRVEAKIRLRYAGVLYEETENSMEAETALSKGIALCERNHYYDLKYAMQFLAAQFMFKKSPKASMKALDGHISDAQTYQHFSWVYAFRFLRATQAMQSGNLTDSHAAIQSLRNIANLADQQGDRAMYLVASLMEAMAHLKSTGPEATEHFQRAMAAAYTYQLDADSRIPQLVGLTHILDVVCSLRQGNPKQMVEKLRALQEMINASINDPAWSPSSDVIAIPIGRTRNHQTVSEDTRMILGVGDDGRDNLMMSFLNKKDAYAITYLLGGMVSLHKSSSDRQGFKYLEQGLTSLAGVAYNIATTPDLLPELTSKIRWRGQILCYFYIYMAFCEAAIADWPGVHKRIDKLRSTAKHFEVSLAGPLGYLTVYLTGVYHQGIGDLDAALQIFQDEKFNLSPLASSNSTSADQIGHDIALLAALNTLWILQEAPRQDMTRNATLVARLEPLCTNHANKDIETAFNLVQATVNTDPATPLYTIKSALKAALSGAQSTANTQFLCITLNVMCARFFANVVGAQAEKSALAASVQAKKSGNVLWRSVADGMLAQCYEVQGKHMEARATLEQAQQLAQIALPDL